MRIITIDMKNDKRYPMPLCACIGYFDGMHKGHQELVRRTIGLAKQNRCESALITFDPDPWETIYGKKDLTHITTMKQRINKTMSLGIQNVIILSFTKQMSELSPEQFTKDVLGRLNIHALVCGFDFHYGHKGRGDSSTLKRDTDWQIEVVDAVEDEEGKISSTRISEAIRSGNMEKARSMLGYPYEVQGTVIPGRHKGTSMGFPTANIRMDREYIIPASGVYACYAMIGAKRWHAMVNVGHNPTMNFTQDISVEAHLINFSGDLYGKTVRLFFIKFIREEKKFRSRDNLIMQLEQDARYIDRLLSEG